MQLPQEMIWKCFCIFSPPDNSADVVDMIESLLQNQTGLSTSELNTVLQKLSDVTVVGIMTTQLANGIISVLSALVDCTPFLAEATNE